MLETVQIKLMQVEWIEYFFAHLFFRTIFVSLARANERVHVHKERNFLQANLDSEINVRFLLNEHGDLYYCMIIVYVLSSLI